jgi:glycosyltransferase involved in cell wall biosynthesis
MDRHADGAAAIRTRVCTIAATNYLPQVRVLAASLAASGHGEPLHVFLVDDPYGQTVVSDAELEVMTLDRVDLEAGWFARMSVYYDVTELATSVKPSVLAGLADADVAVVVYLDPDTELFDNLDDLWTTCAAEDALMLTPHALGPFPRDAKGIEERVLRLSGSFNLGFIAVPNSDEGSRFLRWWAERLRFDAVIDHAEGLFTDQRPVDWAPSLFRTRVVRDPGVNVAYWNLHERPISRRGEVWMAGEAPLRLFHYSSFNPTTPHLVSRHQGSRPRILRSEHPDLGVLLDRYATLLANRGWGDRSGYRWDHLPNGVRLTPWLRRRYRTETMAVTLGHPTHFTMPPEPRGPDWVATFTDWLCEPVHPTVLPRYVDALLDHRGDLRASLDGLDARTFSRKLGDWLATSGIEQEGLTPSLALRLGGLVERWAHDMVAAAARGSGSAPPPPDVEMVNVVGFSGSANGLASGARLVTSLLSHAGIPHRSVPVDHPNHLTHVDDPSHIDLVTPGPALEPADITVACINAETLAWASPPVRHRLLGDGYRVGYWWWEVDVLPPHETHHLHEVDEIWVGSSFVAHLFRTLTDLPVHQVPLPARTPKPTSIDLEGVGVAADATVFSFVFDYSSVIGRKNPLGLINAWRAAFTPDDGCVLVLKSMNAVSHPVEAEAVRHAVADRHDIVMIEHRLTEGELDALVAQSDAYVSLHRAEGLGLTMLDACLLGVPVVASDVGGCMDFLAADSSWLVPTSAVPVGLGNDPYPAVATWAEPDLDVAVSHLREIAADPTAARARAGTARQRALDTYDADMCSAIVAQRVAAIRAGIASHRAVPNDVIR